jgi:hypothetical protein
MGIQILPCGFEIAESEQVLQDDDVAPILKQAGGGGVPEPVQRRVCRRLKRLLQSLLEGRRWVAPGLILPLNLLTCDSGASGALKTSDFLPADPGSR